MNWLENTYYAFSIISTSLQIVILLVVTGIILYLFVRMRRLEKKVKQITPMLIGSKIVGNIVGQIMSKKNKK